MAQDCLEQAATKAAEMGELLEKAQSAINSQGYTTAEEDA